MCGGVPGLSSLSSWTSRKRAGERAQRTLVAPAEQLSLVPSTNMAAYNYMYLQFPGGLRGIRTYLLANTHTHKIKISTSFLKVDGCGGFKNGPIGSYIYAQSPGSGTV